MSNIVSLDAFRTKLREEANQDISYIDLVDRILNLKGVKSGPIVLLHHLAYLMDKGHFRLSYSYLCERIGVGREALSAYIDDLEEKRLIVVRRSRKDDRYNTPNRFEIDFTGPLGDPTTMLKMPRKFNEKGSTKIELPSDGVVRKANGCKPNINTNNISTKVDKRVPAPVHVKKQFDTVADALAFTSKRIVRRRAEKVAAVSKPTSQLLLAGVKAAWATSMLKHYPRVPPVTLTAKDFAIFKARINPLLPSSSITEIFDYFVSSWATLRETKFNWLRAKGKDIALAPSIPELMRYWKIFSQAFADSRMAEVNNEKRTERSREDILEAELAEAKRIAANARSEEQKLRTKLAHAERVAYSSSRDTPEKTVSLSDRRKALDSGYNKDESIADWKQ